MKKITALMLLVLFANAAFSQSNSGAATLPKQECMPNCVPWITNLIIMAPILIFVLLVAAILLLLKKEGFKLGDALKENETMDISVDNPANERPEMSRPASDGTNNAAANIPPPPNNLPPFASKTVQPKSTSRLLAFITGLVSAGLASCLSTFWLFEYMQGKTPDLDAMTNVLLILGLGVVPYAVNKASRAFS